MSADPIDIAWAGGLFEGELIRLKEEWLCESSRS